VRPELAYGWAPDSKAVIFSSDWNGGLAIVKQRLDDDAGQPLVIGLHDLPGSVRVSSDSAWILFPQLEEPRRGPAPVVELMRAPMAGGPPQEVLEARRMPDFKCGKNPASLCVLEERSSDGRQLTITAFDPVRGRTRQLRTMNVDPTTAYYLGGVQGERVVALLKTGQATSHIRLLSLTGGADRDITVKGWRNLWTIDWSADGTVFYCGSLSPQRATLLRVDLLGRARALWSQKGLGITRHSPPPTAVSWPLRRKPRRQTSGCWRTSSL
jgi:hypothetical protein